MIFGFEFRPVLYAPMAAGESSPGRGQGKVYIHESQVLTECLSASRECQASHYSIPHIVRVSRRDLRVAGIIRLALGCRKGEVDRG